MIIRARTVRQSRPGECLFSSGEISAPLFVLTLFTVISSYFDCDDKKLELGFHCVLWYQYTKQCNVFQILIIMIKRKTTGRQI